MLDITDGLELTNIITEGFSFNGFDTRAEKYYLLNRSAPTPSEKEIIDSVAFQQGNYDFSMMMGDRVFANRTITYDLMLLENSYHNRKTLQTVLENQLMRVGVQRLEDTHDPGYYYMGKCESVSVEDDHEYGRLVASVTFDCYPFKTSILPEGHDVWDEINFELDYFQETSAYSDMGTFKELPIGSYATIGAYASAFAGWDTISPAYLGRSRRILEKHDTTQGNSRRAYKLEGVDGLVLEQDIVQSRANPTMLTLYNPGSASVVPTITTDAKISILKDNQVFNVFRGTSQNELFRLKPGQNDLIITSIYPTNVDFRFHKELI